MAKDKAKKSAQRASGGNVLVGVWLILAPFALGYSGLERAVWNDMVVGVAIIVLAIARIASPVRQVRLSWTNTVLGAWLIVAPFLLDYSSFEMLEEGTSIDEAEVSVTAASWNDVVVGLIVIGLSFWSAVSTKAPDRAV